MHFFLMKTLLNCDKSKKSSSQYKITKKNYSEVVLFPKIKYVNITPYSVLPGFRIGEIYSFSYL